MIPYWCLLAYFIVGALGSRDGEQSRGSVAALWFGGLFLTLAIGLRLRVGGDWGTYQMMFARAGLIDIDRLLAWGDPAYQLLNWFVQRADGPFWLVNLACAALFTWGLVRFSMVQRNPWLALLVAVPYFVIVVAMGYTRQAVAIGIIMMGLAAMQRGASVMRFGFYVAAAALFHKTAVVAMLLVALTGGRRSRALNLMIIAASGVLLYDSLLQNSMGDLIKNYVGAKYSSQGAAIRIGLCMLPATLFLLFRRRMVFNEFELSLWRNASFTAFAALIALALSPSSTAVDRIALYLLPMQLAILSQLPRILRSANGGKILLIVYAVAIQFGWLFFATNANYWIPYSSYIGIG